MRNVFDTILTPFLWPKTTAKSFKMPLLTTYYSTLQSTVNYHSTLTVIAGNMIYNETAQTQIVCRDFDDKKLKKNQGKNRVDSREDTLSDKQKSVIKRRYGEA